MSRRMESLFYVDDLQISVVTTDPKSVPLWYSEGNSDPLRQEDTMASKTSALRISVTPELHAELDRIAKMHDVSVAHVVRRAIRFYLTENQHMNSFGEAADVRRS